MSNKSKKKKAEQLGMDPGTANYRLLRDTMWRLVVQCDLNKCYRCGSEMERENFSVEHINPWLDSADPVGLFFDQENISFSHLRCNISDSRVVTRVLPHGSRGKYRQGCKCDLCLSANATYKRSIYTTENRRARFKRTGN